MKLLLFGASGYLGKSIQHTFSQIQIIPDDYTDISKFPSVLNSIENHKPDWVLNTAAKTNEDEAEENIEYWRDMIDANLVGAINILKVCHMKNMPLCYIRTPFEQTPIDDYSLSKISAYQFIGAKKYENLVLSILGGWYFGLTEYSHQFDKLLIRSIKEKFPLGLTNNSYCSPVFMPDFCRELELAILSNKRGNISIAGTEKATRYEFAKCLAENLGKSMEDFGWTENNNFLERAKRPSDWSIFSPTHPVRSYKEAMNDFIKQNF